MKLDHRLFGFLLLVRCTHASIVDMDTGRRFSSRQETLGKRLWRGYEYPARLQYMNENPWLCPTYNSDYDYGDLNVTVPTDGLPVALIARGGGGCTLKEKADFALNHILPKGVVNYLIVGSGHKALGETEENASYMTSVQNYLGDFLPHNMILNPTSQAASQSLNNNVQYHGGDDDDD